MTCLRLLLPLLLALVCTQIRAQAPSCDWKECLFAYCRTDTACALAFSLDATLPESFNRRTFLFTYTQFALRLEPHPSPNDFLRSETAPASLLCIQNECNQDPALRALLLSLLRLTNACEINEYYRVGRGCLCRDGEAGPCAARAAKKSYFSEGNLLNLIVAINCVLVLFCASACVSWAYDMSRAIKDYVHQLNNLLQEHIASPSEIACRASPVIHQ